MRELTVGIMYSQHKTAHYLKRYLIKTFQILSASTLKYSYLGRQAGITLLVLKELTFEKPYSNRSNVLAWPLHAAAL